MSTKSIISKDIRIINKQARGGIEKKKPFTTIMASKPQGISSLEYRIRNLVMTFISLFQIQFHLKLNYRVSHITLTKVKFIHF